jgi:protein tyrosine/serine phosphatase
MRRFWLRAAPAVLLSSSALAQQAITTPILASDQNFRDVAGVSASNRGTGFADTASNSGVMRTGVFYRSEVLNLTNADLATISSLRIGHDIDLRTPSEIAGTPDRVPNGATYTNVNIYGTAAPPSSGSVTTPAAAAAYFESQYRAFVTDPNQRAAFHTVLVSLANDPDAALFHCSGGKDRTGWTAMLLQDIAGVPRATILQDYLATNSYTAVFINASLAAASAQAGGGAAGAYAASVAAPMLGVQPSFLESGLDQAVASYGSVQAYLTQGLGLSQADIYVLRAKMVRYLTLPGQSGFSGNAAAGAALLNALQDSPLSGHYTAFNDYLQSAIDAGTLGDVETQVGGQVHADAAASLLRQPLWIAAAVRPYMTGRDLVPEETRIWLSGLGDYLSANARPGVAGSIERSGGPVLGATLRIGDRASAYLGIGYVWGSVASAAAIADVGTLLGTIGGRYGLATLDTGPYVAASTDVGGIDYQSRRTLGGGLGAERGSTNGGIYGAEVDLGDVIVLAPLTVTPQAGVRVAHLGLGGFEESGSELALHVNRINHTTASVLADVNMSLDPRPVGDWTLSPGADLGLELALGNPLIASTASIYGLTVNQYAAYDSRYLMMVGVGATAEHGAFTVKAGVNAVHGDGANGINAQLSFAYRF